MAHLLRSLPKIAEAAPEIVTESTTLTDGYRVLVRTALMDRHIDSNEENMLRHIAGSDHLDENKVAEVLMAVKKELGIGPQTEQENTYFSVLKTALLDGGLSEPEEAMLQSMQASLNMNADRVEALKKDAWLQIPNVTKPATPEPAPVTSP